MKDLKGALEGAPQAEEMLEQITAMTGVDILSDVLPSIGDTVITYVSDSTGGGSLASQVFLISLADRAKLTAANGKLITYVNEQLSNEETARGYISVRKWSDEGSGAAEFYSVRFPGVPIPLEPTYAMTDKHLIIGLSPQAAVAAVRQATGKGGPGIMSNATIAGALPKGRKLNSFSFSDTSKVLKAGYPYVCAMGSMVGNLVRSRDGQEGGKMREPGMIVPTYSELIANVKPQVSYSYWDGKNLVSEWRGDKSMLVNMGAVVGQYSTYWPIIAALAAGGAAAAANAQNGGFPGMPPMNGMDEGGEEPEMR